MTMRIFYQPTTDPAFNLACEEYLLHHTEDEVLMLWQNAPSIIIGKNQNTVAEINRDFVTDHRIPVIRRLTGGGAVYHDLGNLNYTFIKRHSRDAFNDYRTFAAPVIDLLARFGITATLSGRNDILVDGKKVSGNAQMAHGDSVLHHGTLLFSSDLTMLSQALNVHPLKVKSKGVASVRSRVANLADYGACDIPTFVQALLNQFPDGTLRPLSEGETARVEQIKKDRYDTWEWNYGTRLPYTIQNTAYLPAGLLTAEVDVAENRVRSVRIYGDFFGQRDISQLESALCGLLYREDTLRSVLETLPLDEYISGIHVSELLSILL